MINTKEELIEHLRELGNGERMPRFQFNGLCHELQRTVNYATGLRRLCFSLMLEWPEFSGNSVYPVPHPTMDPHRAYDFVSPDKMWGEGEYAAARRRLCLFLADSLEPFWGFNFSNKCKMWHRGEYAKARKRLCLFLADKLEQEGA